MNAKELQDLINFIANSGLDEVNIETNDVKLRVKRHSDHTKLVEKAVTAQPFVTPMVQPTIVTQPAVVQPISPMSHPEKTERTTVENPATAGSGGKLVAIKSPMIGTFYRASSPEKPAFANVGDEIKKGQVVCIIEAMKLFNEIESEISGKIVKVLVDNASPVEYDQELFLVELH